MTERERIDMETKKLPYVMYWIIIGVGALSYAAPLFQEYGFVTTLTLTFLCGIFSWAVAMGIGKRLYMYISVLLLVSPWIFFLSLNLFD